MRRVDRVVEVPAGLAPFRLVDDRGVEVGEVSAFLALLVARDYSPNTVRAYAYDLLKLYVFFDDLGISVDEFTPVRAIDFLKWLRVTASRGGAQRLGLTVATRDGPALSARTCNRIFAAVSSFFEFLISSGVYLDGENPIVKVPDRAVARVADRRRPPLLTSSTQRPVRRALRVRTIDSVPRVIAPDVYERIVAELKCVRDRALLELMHEGGLRPGEVLGLHLEDVAYGHRRVAIRHRDDHPRGVRQKSRRERVVDMFEDRALPLVNEYVMSERPRDADTSLIFLIGGTSPRRWEPLSYDGLVRLFKRACQRAGVRQPWLTPHTLRHTHATRMFEGGMRELTLMKRLGHASVETVTSAAPGRPQATTLVNAPGRNCATRRAAATTPDTRSRYSTTLPSTSGL